MTDHAIRCPGRKFDLGHQERIDPAGITGIRPRHLDKRRAITGKLPELASRYRRNATV
jgi:hypothetical protein